EALCWGLDWLVGQAVAGDGAWHMAWQVLTLLRDRPLAAGHKKPASILTLVDEALRKLFAAVPLLAEAVESPLSRRRVTWDTRQALLTAGAGQLLVMDTAAFPPEGDESAATWLVKAGERGWRHIIAYNWHGGRFAGTGFGPAGAGLRLDLYGDIGDYAASGIDGAEVHLHTDGQDQLGQIMKDGKLVIHGDVGQTFLYGAKGGEI